MSHLDQSLDDIISSQPRNRGIRKSRRGLRINKTLASAATGRQTTNKSATGTTTTGKAGSSASAPNVDAASVFDQGSKIIVSNLPGDVTEQQIKDLFNVQIGRVAKCSLAYGPQGVSKGVATIQFAQKGDGKKAYDRYDGKLIDNTRRLKIEIIMDPSRTKPALAQRIQQTPIVSVAAAPRAGAKTGGKGGRGGGRGRRGGRSGGSGRRPPKTTEDLDQEMQDYYDQANNTAGSATTGA